MSINESIKEINDGKEEVHLAINGDRWITIYPPAFTRMGETYQSLYLNPRLILSIILKIPLVICGVDLANAPQTPQSHDNY